MIGQFTAHVSQVRKEARQLAATTLEQLGFRPGKDGWSGQLSLSDGSSFRVNVVLPPEFPDVLPEIFLAQSEVALQIAHVERSGAICIAPKSGTLLDVERPGAIVAQALSMAAAVLQGRSAANQSRELQSEFTAYWAERGADTLLSICSPCNPSGVIVLAKLPVQGVTSLIAPSRLAAYTWAEATNKTIETIDEGYFVRLASVPTLPRFNELLALRQLLYIVRTHASPEIAAALRSWLTTHGIPSTVVLSAPLDDNTDHVLFAARLDPSASAMKDLERGYRKGHAPRQVVVNKAMGKSIRRLDVLRVDPDYLLPRGGADPSLRDKTVTIVGCGSVGSCVAQALAAAGIGTLVLVDPEDLEPGNLHRHVLGARFIGEPKAVSLAKVLRERFPHLQVHDYPQRIEDVLDKSERITLSSDVLVVAIGHETLELRLNSFLHGQMRRIHVWLEPLGLGGHVLSLRKNGPGCFACLYRHDDDHGLMNMASLVEPGQIFQRTIGGCAGTFTSFGMLDAEQAAVLASRETVAVLGGQKEGPSLISWISSRESFLRNGYRLSRRGNTLMEGRIEREELRLARLDCPECGNRAT
jgi:molybdopterin-synthase adenylyltransferase